MVSLANTLESAAVDLLQVSNAAQILVSERAAKCSAADKWGVKVL